MKKHSEKYDTARPYLASYVILRRNNAIAMVLRKNTGYMDGHYGLPAGKVEYGETYVEGAVREAKEEAGVDIQLKDLRFVHTVHRHGENDHEFMDWIDMYYEADTWEGEPYNAEEEMSERLDWLDFEDLPDNIIPAQRAALLAIEKGEAYSEFGWK